MPDKNPPPTESFDYIIVGAGTAGCILAARLAERPNTRIAVLEAGPKASHLLVEMPLAFGKALARPDLTWQISSSEIPTLGGRKLSFPRGRIVGGTSAINGMIHTRGGTADYNDWAAHGCEGWGFADVDPYFARAEGRLGFDGGLPRLANPPPVARAFVEAGTACAEGIADVPQIAISRGRRRSAAYALPKSVKVVRDCHVDKVLIREARAYGVTARVSGRPTTFVARGEVVLCAGAFQTPNILFHSGIGDESVLRTAGIVVTHHLPGVGQSLQDHFGVPLAWEARDVKSLNALLQSKPRLLIEAVRWGLWGKGALARPLAEALFFARTNTKDPLPDVEVILRVINGASSGAISGTPAFSLNVMPLRPESRGRVRPSGPDPEAMPIVEPAYLTAQSDIDATLRALRLARRIVATPQMDTFSGAEIVPGVSLETDHDLLDYAKHAGASASHHVGSCRMGRDPDAVVDHRLRIQGLRGLRIVDGSIMPVLPGAHPNAVIMMIAEKAGDMILEKAS